jgi:hypothetical protein
MTCVISPTAITLAGFFQEMIFDPTLFVQVEDEFLTQAFNNGSLFLIGITEHNVHIIVKRFAPTISRVFYVSCI